MAVETNVTFDFASLSVPTIYANRFQVTVTGDFLKIAFAEGMEGKNFQYRTAMIMTIGDARELAQVISATIEAQLETRNG